MLTWLFLVTLMMSWWFTLFQIFKNNFLRYIQNNTNQ